MTTSGFEVGGIYANRVGAYRVTGIYNGDINVRYENGFETTLPTDISWRIFKNIEAESSDEIEAAERRRYTEHVKEIVLPDLLERLEAADPGGASWTYEEAIDLLDVVGHPEDDGKSKAYAEHGRKWGRSDTAARYMYERLHPEYYANTRDLSR